MHSSVLRHLNSLRSYFSSLHKNLCKIERNQFCSLHLKEETAAINVSIPKKVTPRKRNKTEADVMEVRQYFSKQSAEYLRDFPVRFIAKNSYPPEALYLVNPIVAGQISYTISKYLKNQESPVPVFEMNPGLGLLTKEFISSGVKNLKIFEPSLSFHSHLLNIVNANKKENIELRDEDLCNIARIVYQDKVTDGNRVDKIMLEVKTRPWNDPCPALRIVGTTPNKKFLRNLLFSIAFQSGLASRGRPEYYLIMHPPNYLQLMSQPHDEYSSYRYNSALFQIMYDTELLDKLPRKEFLPWETKRSFSNKFEKFKKIRSIDCDELYLVRIVGNPNLPDFVPLEQMPLLWYFFRINLLSRKKKVIPALEQWVPDCGVRLINQGFSIFTEFGDLKPKEMLKLFVLFSKWPEFPHCSFQTSLESMLLRNFAAEADGQDDVDEEDEQEASDDTDTSENIR